MSNIGKFTGDVLRQGYDLGRNSSRVLAPPGGACSDIFGTASAPVQRNAQHTATQNKRNQSSLFGSPQQQATAEVHARAAARRGESHIFGSPVRHNQNTSEGVSSTFSNEPTTQVAATQVASPIRREKHAEIQYTRTDQNKARSVHTSSRVLAPPGGRCHNIFG